MKPSEILHRVRDSQFVLPALFIAASIVLVYGTNQLDGNLTSDGRPFLLPATVFSGRQMLATVAGSIITVAAVVFSLTALTVQMAASQYSPRVIQGFLRDRFQQTALGIVIGTFTFALIGLATLGADPADGARADWTATVGLVLGVGSAVLIVAYIDHVTRRIRVDDTITRLAAETTTAFRRARPPTPGDDDASWDIPTDTESVTVRAGAGGWVRHIDLESLAAALPGSAIGRIDVPPGQYATYKTSLVTIWQQAGAEPPDEARILDAFTIGGTRTINRDDPGFGLRQLVDIALRALSPGINDPATAADVVRQLAGPIREAYASNNVKVVYVHPSGTRLVQPRAMSASDALRLAYSEIRLVAADQPTVLMALAESLIALRESLSADGMRTDGIRQEIEHVRKAVEASALEESDARPILTVLDRELSADAP